MNDKLKELLELNAVEIDREIEKLIPKNIDSIWLDNALGGDFEYDEEACNKAIICPIWDLLERGGKRWRPFLMKISYALVGGNEKGLINKFSVIPELIHNGTLIIDDIEDDSYTRRGRLCIHKLFRQDIAINAGNSLYYLPLISLIKDSFLDANKKAKIYEVINEEMIKLSFGQGMDIYWHNNNYNVTEKRYLQMCAYKTGTLARMSAKLGAILGNGTDEQVEMLGKFAESVGIAFQIKDDILNITSRDWGKDFGEDITEGKKSLLIINTLEQADDIDKKRLCGILNQKTKDRDSIEEGIDIIKKYSAVDYSKNFAENLISEAWQKINALFPDSDSKNKLKLFAEFMVERDI